MEFKDNLVRLRKERGLSQENLALEVGVSRQAVSKWETGEAMPDLPKLIAIADVLDISIDELCGRAYTHTGAPPYTPPQPPVAPPKSRRGMYILLGIGAFVVISILALIMLIALFRFRNNDIAHSDTSEAADVQLIPELPDTLSASNITFGTTPSGYLSYYFVPNVIDEDCTYRLIAVDKLGGKQKTFDIDCVDGVCSGAVGLSGGTYDLSLFVSDNNKKSLSVPLASNLTISGSRVNWTPIE